MVLNLLISWLDPGLLGGGGSSINRQFSFIYNAIAEF